MKPHRLQKRDFTLFLDDKALHHEYSHKSIDPKDNDQDQNLQTVKLPGNITDHITDVLARGVYFRIGIKYFQQFFSSCKLRLVRVVLVIHLNSEAARRIAVIKPGILMKAHTLAHIIHALVYRGYKILPCIFAHLDLHLISNLCADLLRCKIG